MTYGTHMFTCNYLVNLIYSAKTLPVGRALKNGASTHNTPRACPHTPPQDRTQLARRLRYQLAIEYDYENKTFILYYLNE